MGYKSVATDEKRDIASREKSFHTAAVLELLFRVFRKKHSFCFCPHCLATAPPAPPISMLIGCPQRPSQKGVFIFCDSHPAREPTTLKLRGAGDKPKQKQQFKRGVFFSKTPDPLLEAVCPAMSSPLLAKTCSQALHSTAESSRASPRRAESIRAAPGQAEPSQAEPS